MKNALSLLVLASALPAIAEETRHLDSHEHGVSALNIAIDGTTVAMELHAPGADIVGFEYAASSDADHAAVEAAVALLGAPLDLFVMPSAAACTVMTVEAELEGEEDHEAHGEDRHGEHHDNHDKEHKEDHHDGHNEKHHDEHAEDDQDDHAEHSDEAGHTEFHAAYTLNCENPEALTEITFAYFEAFPNSLEVEVQIIASSGAQAFEVERDAPVLNLER